MGAMNAVSLVVSDEREELIIRLAEMAGILRSARSQGAAVPMVCLLDCTARHWIRWGDADRCTNCGTPALSAEVWHRLLVGALRHCSARIAVERRAA